MPSRTEIELANRINRNLLAQMEVNRGQLKVDRALANTTIELSKAVKALFARVLELEKVAGDREIPVKRTLRFRGSAHPDVESRVKSPLLCETCGLLWSTLSATGYCGLNRYRTAGEPCLVRDMPDAR